MLFTIYLEEIKMRLRIFTEGLRSVPEIQTILTMDKEDFLKMDYNERQDFLERVSNQLYDMPISPIINIGRQGLGKHTLATLRYANFKEAHESLSASQPSM